MVAKQVVAPLDNKPHDVHVRRESAQRRRPVAIVVQLRSPRGPPTSGPRRRLKCGIIRPRPACSTTNLLDEQPRLKRDRQVRHVRHLTTHDRVRAKWSRKDGGTDLGVDDSARSTQSTSPRVGGVQVLETSLRTTIRELTRLYIHRTIYQVYQGWLRGGQKKRSSSRIGFTE